ncbi:MAG: glycoside hydrolase family 36 protein [Candidatus Dormibacter sp.]|uniref:glycoside hydrolase family 36 protein n=1 Tax=Candidatus Dormibacter sp. TaxID=2973982 RepID=UPI000DB370E6|nr:MAG: glycoside hydrolase [Candidatus Dormibacteraeota bacterium]
MTAARAPHPVSFIPIAEIPLRPDTLVYEHGWQSWSPAGLHPARSTSSRPRTASAHTMGYRPGLPLPEHGFQSEGLLAVLPGAGEPVRLFSARKPADCVPSLRAEVRDGRLLISSTGDGGCVREQSHTSDLGAALAAWAEEAAALRDRPLPKIPPVWCSWYHYYLAVSDEDVLENLADMDRLGIPVGVVQIDDGFEAQVGDWLEPSNRFERPLAEIADRIRASGRRAGIWLAPFLAGTESRLAQEHPDWLLAGADAGHNWGQQLHALDVTNPAAAQWLQNVVSTFRGWGFDYFKLDFLYAGALSGRRRQDASEVGAYREGLRLIREAVGPEATLLGCGAPLLPSIGLVDAMRVSPDVALWEVLDEADLSQPSRRLAMLAGRARAFQQGRLWLNDPDCLIARPAMEGREEWASHIEQFGGLRSASDRLADLDAWGLETTRRLLTPARTEPFPFDRLDLEGAPAA